MVESTQTPLFPNSTHEVKHLCPATWPFLLNAFVHPLIQQISVKHLLYLDTGKTAPSKANLFSGAYISIGESSDKTSPRIRISDSIRCCGENKVIGRLSEWRNTTVGREEAIGLPQLLWWPK